ncbi:MAG: hypothetical protein L6R37_001084 [Teloschistes peruensis]|nr:MAG: hypothetical protein L6R37_001084 [Teloschistes peruensis]
MRVWKKHHDVIAVTWHLGLTAFGGPAVQYQTVSNTLPNPVYALLSGLNAATVGIIALAAVNLAGRAITDKITRILVYLAGGLGMLYRSLWYYPVLMAAAGLTTMIWDLRWLQTSTLYIRQQWTRLRRRWQGSQKSRVRQLEHGKTDHKSWPTSTNSTCVVNKPLPSPPQNSEISTLTESHLKPHLIAVPLSKFAIIPPPAATTLPTANLEPRSPGCFFPTLISTRLGSGILGIFLASFLAIILVRALLPHTTRLYHLFASLYLAGTIIFGGGPVVIPLLREYIVAPGWVSPRDFLLGLAIIQSFPGPNFNFVVYLGALAVKNTGAPSFIGALVAFLAMYLPGLLVMVGALGLWSRLAEKAWFLAVLRGVNASAVGLVFTAVYKLWEIGLVGSEGMGGAAGAKSGGMPLGGDPWLVFITAGAFVGGQWFNVSAPVAILTGGVAGVLKWAVVEAVNR